MLSKRFSQVLVDHAHPLFSLIGHLATLAENAALSLFLWTVLRGHVRRDGGGGIRLPSCPSVPYIHCAATNERASLCKKEGRTEKHFLIWGDRRSEAFFSEEFSSAAAVTVYGQVSNSQRENCFGEGNK